MAFEKQWGAIAPRSFTSDGTIRGVVTLSDTAGFWVKQKVAIGSNTQPQKEFQVKVVLSKTQLVVGPPDNKIQTTSDISGYTVALGAVISAGAQDKSQIPDKDHYWAIYAPDPIVADRVILVDEYGEYYTNENPLPIVIDGTISIGEVEVVGSNGNTIEPNSDGSLNVKQDGGFEIVNLGSAADKDWDDMILARDPVTQDITSMTLKKSGAVVRTVTMIYDDNENLVEVIKS